MRRIGAKFYIYDSGAFQELPQPGANAAPPPNPAAAESFPGRSRFPSASPILAIREGAAADFKAVERIIAVASRKFLWLGLVRKVLNAYLAVIGAEPDDIPEKFSRNGSWSPVFERIYVLLVGDF